MSMKQGGLAKLTEEMGEAGQIVGKLLQYPYHQEPGYPGVHPDGSHLRTRLEEEMGDVYAALDFVQSKLSLNEQHIAKRRKTKLSLFHIWNLEQDR